MILSAISGCSANENAGKVNPYDFLSHQENTACTSIFVSFALQMKRCWKGLDPMARSPAVCFQVIGTQILDALTIFLSSG